jgi:hypothetical protein
VDTASSWARLLGIALIFVVFGGLGAVFYLLIFNRRTRQGLHDLAVGSFVVRGPAAAIPRSLATPRLHLIVACAWLAAMLIAPAVASWLARTSNLANAMIPLGSLQSALQAQVGRGKVKVTKGATTISTVRTGTSTTPFLQVDAQIAECRDQSDADAVMPVIAETVLNLHPDLLGAQVLIVQVSCGFDLGLAHWAKSARRALDVAGWRQQIAISHDSPDANWIRFYQTGTGSAPNVVWNTQYYIDVGSIRREGNLLRYRTRVFHADEDRADIFEMVADCAARTRGQMPSRSLYDTYEGTLGGEEIKRACELAARIAQ